MDWLIIVLIVIGFAVSSSKKKKAQQAKAAQRAQNAPDAPTPPPYRERAASEIKIPYTREEWAAYLKQEGVPAAFASRPAQAAPKPAPEAPKPKAAAPKAVSEMSKPAEARESAPSDRVEMKPNVAAGARSPEPSGSLSAPARREGEHPLEHAEHRRRMSEAETRQQDALEAAEALRTLNLGKLRAAVVMSEVLARPVSMRPHGYRTTH